MALLTVMLPFKGVFILIVAACGYQVCQHRTLSQDINSGTGTIIRTRSNLDLAIEGEGFFVLKDPESGEVFATRRGDFRVNVQGRMINLQGFCLQGFADPIGNDQAYSDGDAIGNITIDRKPPPGFPRTNAGITNVSIDKAGRLRMTLQDGSQFVRGQILLQRFEMPRTLVSHWPQNYTGFDAAQGLSQPEQPGSPGLGTIIASALDSSLFPSGTDENSLLILFDWFNQENRIIAPGAGQSSRLEASSDLSNWVSIYTNQSRFSFEFRVRADALGSVRFYRVISLGTETAKNE